MVSNVVWGKEVKNLIARSVMMSIVVVLTIILIVVASISFILSKIFDKISSIKNKKRP